MLNELEYQYAIVARIAMLLERKITATQTNRILEEEVDAFIRDATRQEDGSTGEYAKGSFERRIKIAKAAIACALALSGGLALLHNQQTAREQKINNAKFVINLILTCIEFVPAPFVGSAASVAGMIVEKGLDWIEGRVPNALPL
jgi:hypothetical protein